MIEMMNVTKKYNKGITAINNLSIQINDGEFVYVVGLLVQVNQLSLK